MKKFLIGLRSQFLCWLMQTWPYMFLLRYVVPNLKLLQAPGPSYFVKEQIRNNMRAGDFLISKAKFNFTNLIIGGKFSHGSVVTNLKESEGGKELLIAEMTANDFDLVDVNHFCKGTTRIALMRFKKYDEKYGDKVSKFCMTLCDRRYDARFNLGVEALYCSELCYQSDYEGRMQADLSDLVGMGRPYLSPDGIYSAAGLEVVYEWEDNGWK